MTYEPTLVWEADAPPPIESPQRDELTPSRLSLYSLPPEIREKIWIETFETRMITVYLRVGKIPNRWPSAAKPYSTYRGICRLVCVTFTAAVDGPPSLKPSSPQALEPGGPPQSWQIDVTGWRDDMPNTMCYALPSYPNYKPHRGPTSLRVCRESRAIALKHYELAFPGWNMVPDDIPFQQQWRDGRFGEGHIWVNFKRDIICVWDGTRRMDQVWHLLGTKWRSNPYLLGFFTKYASADAAKIRRLALQGMWTDKETRLMTRSLYGIPDTGGLLQQALERTVTDFPNLEELWIYNRTCQAPGLDTKNYGKEPYEVEKEVNAVLESIKDRNPGWVAHLPKVIAMWDPFQLEEDMREMEDERHVQRAPTNYNGSTGEQNPT